MKVDIFSSFCLSFLFFLCVCVCHWLQSKPDDLKGLSGGGFALVDTARFGVGSIGEMYREFLQALFLWHGFGFKGSFDVLNERSCIDVANKCLRMKSPFARLATALKPLKKVWREPFTPLSIVFPSAVSIHFEPNKLDL